MECPKCGLEIDDRALVCPNCKKVLKLVCPICKTINTTNTCKKCGYVILSKCHNCGKVNQTILKKCKKCGFSTDKSIILNEANSDDYVLKSRFGFDQENADKFNFAIITKTLNGLEYQEMWILSNAYYDYESQHFVHLDCS